MNMKIRDFFFMLGYYVTLPFNWPAIRKIDKTLARLAAEDRANAMTEKDVEFLRSVGIETDLETLRNGARNIVAKK